MDSIYSIAATQSTQAIDPQFAATSGSAQGTLDQDDFFKLLTTQLTSQDPLKPMEDTEFISQMTSFSSLSEMENIAADMKVLREQQSAFSVQALIGQHVSGVSEDGLAIEGIVTRVAREDGALVPYVGDLRVPMANILEISQPLSNS